MLKLGLKNKSPGTLFFQRINKKFILTFQRKNMEVATASLRWRRFSHFAISLVNLLSSHVTVGIIGSPRRCQKSKILNLRALYDLWPR